MKNKLTIFGEEIIDQSAIDQLKNCIDSDEDILVLTADAHKGYGHPIGGAIGYKNKISLSGVGFDIACGNKAVKTQLKLNDLGNNNESITIEIARIMDEVFKRISFGVGRHNEEKIDHEVFDKIANADFIPQRKLLELAKQQLGTVGSGNHFVDIFYDGEGCIWIGVHFGSRGFGHKTTSEFMALNKGLSFDDKVSEGGMDNKPILFSVDSQIGQDYISAINLASEYAYAGRDCVVNKVLEILGTTADPQYIIHNNHNFAWKENHFSEDYYVVRKGCTPALPGQLGFIGANMLHSSVIVKGIDSDLSKEALYSTVHGAGRILSRTQAAGKKKWIRNEMGYKVPTIISKGLVDFDEVKMKLRHNNIELRGGGADEAPECYKDLIDVLEYHKDTIEIQHILTPLGVAMAGDVYDPYKD